MPSTQAIDRLDLALAAASVDSLAATAGQASALPTAQLTTQELALDSATAREEPPTTEYREADISSPAGSSVNRQARQTRVHWFLPPRPADAVTPSAHRLRVLRSWEGIVLDAHASDETFLARVSDVTSHELSEAEIFLDEVSDEDRTLLQDGAVFYWTIGYRIGPDGRERVSRIKFRRLPAWSRVELNSAEQEASELAEQLSWESAATA